MTRRVKAQREAIQTKKNHGLVTEFVIFVFLRGIDLASSLAVLGNAWTQSRDWSGLNSTALNTSHEISSTTASSITLACQENTKWNENLVSEIETFDTILILTLLFNLISITVFLTHFSFWIATLRIAFQTPVTAGTDNRITRLTRSSLLSLMTAVIRDVPLSCLNIELLVRRSGRDGLACAACAFTRGCVPEMYVDDTLKSAKTLLYVNFSVMFVNSSWKGVSGFYRLSRFKEFQVHYIRACAALVFAFLYCSATFTPATYMLIYRYFTIPGMEPSFVNDIAKRVVVIGSVVLVVAGSAFVCCPILYAIRLTAD